MRINHKIKSSLLAAGAVALSGLLSGCLMHDDLEPCAVPPTVTTSVDFIYDYNTKAADLFGEQVGSVTLYVFDHSGRLVGEETRSGLTRGNRRIELDLAPGTYTAYAVALAHKGGYDASLALPGAKFRRNGIGSLAPEGNALLSLDRSNALVEHAGVMLDTLWTSQAVRTLTVPEVGIPVEGDVQQPDIEVSATIPLMRVTNHLAVTFWQSDFPTLINPAYYDVRIEFPTGNGDLDLLGQPVGSGLLSYSPYKVSQVTKTQQGVQTQCLTLEFGLSRLMVSENARMVITNRITGHVTTVDNLPRLLAEGRAAYDSFNWGEQEYLDREYDYSIEFPLDDAMPRWVQVNVEVLGWAKRILNTDL